MEEGGRGEGESLVSPGDDEEGAGGRGACHGVVPWEEAEEDHAYEALPSYRAQVEGGWGEGWDEGRGLGSASQRGKAHLKGCWGETEQDGTDCRGKGGVQGPGEAWEGQA